MLIFQYAIMRCTFVFSYGLILSINNTFIRNIFVILAKMIIFARKNNKRIDVTLKYKKMMVL